MKRRHKKGKMKIEKMNRVKFYFLCKDETERKFARSQCDYIQKGNANEREGGHLNVKYILNSNSYKEGFIVALDMIKSNALYDFGVIIVGNNHLHRRLYSAVKNLSLHFLSYLERQKNTPRVLLDLGFNFTPTPPREIQERKVDFVLQEKVPKLFSLHYSHCPSVKSSFGLDYEKSYFISRSFVQTESIDLQNDSFTIAKGYVNPPVCVTSDVYSASSLVHYCKEKIEYIATHSMVHYCSRKKESLFNSLFDAVYCINLESRPDRLLKLQQRLKIHNIEFERYNAVSKALINPFSQILMPDDPLLKGSANKAGLLACLLSHMGVMKVALSRGQEQVVIFEDDVSVHKDFEYYLQSFLTSLKQNSIEMKTIDVIHFGYVPIVQKGNYELNDIWSYRFLDHYNGCGTLLKSKHFIGCHAYAVSAKFMRAYIQFYEALDPITNGGEWPTNDWAVRNFFLENKDFSCFAPCPQIFAVSPSVSDNSGLTEEDHVEERVTNSNFTYFDDYE